MFEMFIFSNIWYKLIIISDLDDANNNDTICVVLRNYSAVTLAA